ncbi:YchJ family metal-binding protein [Gilvimarinus sp. SDUM040013]|uniref:YchJ family metal-binding protein n=1 Tax=Gilvimarinus gilvus TaxID=3058038 RepID=A0ABU4RUA4_9GAMM|nr:YchJ family metal-binding protein [Gilvimarinus sp. SDUM040013]MDO3388286.1 YchJ family metal-binding protein [Gilvimarinus sp. SDUM040013]MDX6847836.1 YchJ family metal-binding protein [Gilvimarinus sp. SDUM040013]
MPLAAPNYCPCGSTVAASQCCSRFIYQGQAASTALELMRSRYSGHVCGAIEYLWETWSESTRHRTSIAAIREWATSCEWLGLEILDWQGGGHSDSQGTVTFSATYRIGQQTHRHLEKSAFCRENGFWRYFDHCA